jgi:small GTP-binding protein
MPHRTQQQVIKRRLRDKEGSARVKELRAILAELPGYKNGPYADLRKWVEGQLEETRTRNRVVHRDSIAVKRQGAAQVAIVGAPNAGKSSLLQALSDVQIKTGDYAFTTTRPLPAVIRAGGVLVQLVEIPGLIEGAAEDRGGGRALLGVVRSADAIVLCQAAATYPSDLELLRVELDTAGIDLPTLVAITRVDEAPDGFVPPDDAVAVSILDDASLEAFREAVWSLTGLLRVHLCKDGEVDPDPITLEPPATVTDVARAIHKDLGDRCKGARLWGGTARFDGQRVGPGHEVLDGDVVEILTT